jgi:fucose permease
MLLLIVIYIAFISLGLPDSLFGVSWPVVHLEFGMPESFASVYTIILAVCTGGVSFVAGRVIRKFGTGKVTFFSTLLTAIGLVGISFAPNIVVMVIFSIILGYGAGAIDTGLNSYVSLHYKAKYLNWLHCFWGMGVAISPMIMSGFLGAGEGQWRNGYRVVALLQLAIALIILATLKKWDPETEQEQQESAKADMTMAQLLRLKGLPTSILSLGLYCGAEYLLGTWGATFAVHVFELTPDIAAKWVSLYYGGIMVGRIITGFVPDSIGDDLRVKIGAVIALAGIVFLALPLGNTALAGLLLIGIGFGPVFPAVIHSVPRRFGATYSADLTGYHMGGAFTMGYIVQLTFGYVAVWTGYGILPYLLLALILGVFALHTITIRQLKQKTI